MNRLTMKRMLAGLALVAAMPLMASTPEAWGALEARVATACTAASGFAGAKVSPATVRFSDRFGVDARLVAGTYRQPAMKGAQGLVLCLYDRRTRRAEVQPADAWQRR